MEQQNLICLITGATSGIGEATAKKFAENGYDLILTGRRADRLDLIATQIREQHGRKVLTLVFDVRDRKQTEDALAKLEPEWRSVAVLVNNAGLALGKGPLQKGNVDDWETMIDTNVKGLLYMTRIVAPWMTERREGHIINIGSIAGKEWYPGGNVYSASKFAVRAISKSLRIDLLEYGIRVTDVQPGLVETEFSIVRFKGDQDKANAVYDGMDPLTANDIAEIVWWVAARPAHVCIDEIQVTATAQGDSRTVIRK